MDFDFSLFCGHCLLCAYIFFFTFQPDGLLSSRIQSLCPTITGNVCCNAAQFDTLRDQVQQVGFLSAANVKFPLKISPFLVFTFSYIFLIGVEEVEFVFFDRILVGDSFNCPCSGTYLSNVLIHI